MKKWVKFLCLAAFTVVCILPMAAWASPPKENSEDFRTVARTRIWKSIQTGHTGSATIAVMDKGSLVYSEGFGAANREKSIPVDSNTLFNIGSISKVYCATAIMLLVDEGKVELDKPVTAYIPEFTMADGRYRDITVRMLLNHSSGLPGGSYANSFGYQYHEPFLSETLQTLSRSHLKHRPGERAVYCNDGFTLAEIVVERASGQKYSRFLTDRIFKPLSLRRTGLNAGQLPDTDSAAIAGYYDPKGRPEPREVVAFLGSGGLSATAEDLCRVADTFSSAGKQILSIAGRTEMRKNQPADFWSRLRKPSISFGLGWDFTELPDYKAQNLAVLGKSGGTGQYASMLYTLPDHRISVAVIGTGPKAQSQEIALAVLDAYAAEKGLLKPKPKEVFVPVKAQAIPAVWLEFEGYYAGDGGTVVKMALNQTENTLVVSKAEGDTEKPLLSAVYNADYFHSAKGKKFYFFTVDQQRYLVSSDTMDYVVYQKIEPLDDPAQLKIDASATQWLRRNVKPYEGTMSTEGHIETARPIPQLAGYIDFGGVKKITSPSFAGVFLASVRDASELSLFERDNRQWAWVSGLIFMPADLAPALEIGESEAVIGIEGYNEWRKISRDSILGAGAPAKGRVILFDPTGNVLYDNVLDSGPVFAPSGSFLEMAGNSGDRFALNLKSVKRTFAVDKIS